MTCFTSRLVFSSSPCAGSSPERAKNSDICRERTCQMDYFFAGLCAVFLLFYLIYALLKPERF
ncbi:MAG: K(+)-transporting ATPase subunit F [Bryobacterales bacterium]|nr:K(+)-transporting ATPase subunit F [Bryobacterales bacterium]